MQTLRSSQDVVAENLAYTLFSWSAQGDLKPMTIAGGEGAWFWDFDGNRYLDLCSQQVVALNLGHQHPKVVAAIKEQADTLCYAAPSFASEPKGQLARRLVEKTNLAKVFFTLGGAEANENAMKIARQATGRQKIITRYRSYHGATAGAISASGDYRRWAAEPGVPGIVRVPDPFVYRSPFGDDPETVGRKTVEFVEEVIQYEGPETIAAMLVETVTGTNGLIIPPDNYLPLLQEVLRKYGILLICDEVMSGFGRTGSWFAYQHWGVQPDMVTMAKGLTGSYVPLGAVAVSAEVADHFEDRTLWAGLTYAGHPLACAAGLAAVEAYDEEGLIERSRDLGEFLRDRLHELKDRHPIVGDVRSIGLFGALELVKNRATKEPLSPLYGPQAASMKQLVAHCRSRGVDIMTRFNWVFVTPPLVISQEDLAWGLDVLDEALDNFVTGS